MVEEHLRKHLERRLLGEEPALAKPGTSSPVMGVRPEGDVEIREWEGRLQLVAYQEGSGHEFATVDLVDLIAWLKLNFPKVMQSP